MKSPLALPPEPTLIWTEEEVSKADVAGPDARDAATAGRMAWPAYDGMVAPPGALPRAVVP